jgi:CDGSH-type Zn-finger protein
MKLPVVAARKPAVLVLEPGRYAWCTCGLSNEQPWCSGAHGGTGWTTLFFTVEEKKRVALCQCKHTKTPPYCDGTHARLDE